MSLVEIVVAALALGAGIAFGIGRARDKGRKEGREAAGREARDADRDRADAIRDRVGDARNRMRDETADRRGYRD